MSSVVFDSHHLCPSCTFGIAFALDPSNEDTVHMPRMRFVLGQVEVPSDHHASCGSAGPLLSLTFSGKKLVERTDFLLRRSLYFHLKEHVV